MGHYRDLEFDIEVQVRYEPRTDLTSEMVMAIQSHLESLFNAQNYGATIPTWYYYITDHELLHSLSESILIMSIKAVKGLVSATA